MLEFNAFPEQKLEQASASSSRSQILSWEVFASRLGMEAPPNVSPPRQRSQHRVSQFQSVPDSVNAILRPEVLQPHRADKAQAQREAEISALYTELRRLAHSDTPADRREYQDRISRLRALQELEAERVTERFQIERALAADQGYAALALGQSLLDKYAHFAAKDRTRDDADR
jgi:hypothetical protein